MDKDTFPKPDDFLGKAELTAQDFYPNGFHGELALADSKTQATLTVKVIVTGCDEADPEMAGGVEWSSRAAVLPSGVVMQGLQVYNPGATTTSHSMTCSAPQTDSVLQTDMVPQADSAPQTDSVPQAPMNDMVIASVVESQAMASARLEITVESACNLYNSDGFLAGKSDPYVIMEVPGQDSMKLQTEVISNELNPVWNFTGEIAGFMDGDVLRFTVMDKDTFPKPDDLLGWAELSTQDVYPNGFHGDLMLSDKNTSYLDGHGRCHWLRHGSPRAGRGRRHSNDNSIGFRHGHAWFGSLYPVCAHYNYYGESVHDIFSAAYKFSTAGPHE